MKILMPQRVRAFEKVLSQRRLRIFMGHLTCLRITEPLFVFRSRYSEFRSISGFHRVFGCAISELCFGCYMLYALCFALSKTLRCGIKNKRTKDTQPSMSLPAISFLFCSAPFQMPMCCFVFVFLFFCGSCYTAAGGLLA